MRTIFATHRLPRTLVTNNGPCFISQEFEDFLRSNGVVHTHSAPYHPATNGLAERAVQTVKQGIRRQNKDEDLEKRISIFLLQYRVTPQSTTGVSPCQLLMGRRLHTRLDRIFPNKDDLVEKRQKQQAAAHDSHACKRRFSVGDTVFVRNYSTSHVERWISGIVTAAIGPVNYECSTEFGLRRCHIDHMRPRSENQDNHVSREPLRIGQEPSSTPGAGDEHQSGEENNGKESGGQPTEVTPPAETSITSRPQEDPNRDEATPSGVSDQRDRQDTPQQSNNLRRSQRIRHPPNRLSF